MVYKKRIKIPIADMPVPQPGPVKTLKDIDPDVLAALKAKYELPPAECACKGYIARPTHDAQGRTYHDPKCPVSVARARVDATQGRVRIKMKKKRVNGHGGAILYALANAPVFETD